MPDNKPVSAQEAVVAYNTLRDYCKHMFARNCDGCILSKNRNYCFVYSNDDDCSEQEAFTPDNWPDIADAPHA